MGSERREDYGSITVTVSDPSNGRQLLESPAGCEADADSVEDVDFGSTSKH